MQLVEQLLKNRIYGVMPRFNPKEDEISLFLVLFERQAKIINIPVKNKVSQLNTLLSPDIVQLIDREPEEDAKKYEYVKSLLIKRVKLNAEKFRQLFNKHQKAPGNKLEINCELAHTKKAAVVTNYPGRYVLGNKTAQLFKDKLFLNLEKVNAVLTRSQVKRSREEDRNKEDEMEQLEDIRILKLMKKFCHKLMKNIRKLKN
ncbi:hypothetical protein AVEN_109156-1 [Araneus ventricosus]|uniref:Uncharacterized protein n=1 Tax=Araneus ventricosus TaxID=182803 RepID=A0A4Y2ITK1_ARAVE|nr:hypothetical protein AVEN_109156-1 [Araneus ventricosus]